MFKFPKKVHILWVWGENTTKPSVTGPIRSYNCHNRKGTSITGLLESCEERPGFWNSCYDCPPKAKAGVSKAPQKQVWDKPQPCAEERVPHFLCVWCFGAPVGAVLANRDAINVTLLFWYSACVLKAQKGWIYSVLCHTIYCESHNSSLDIWLSNHRTSGLVMLMQAIWPCFLCEQSYPCWFI